MKKAILISFLILANLAIAIASSPCSFNVLQAQPSVVGVWEWRSNTEVFKLTIEHVSAFKLPDGTTTAAIIGRYSYSLNGIVVSQSMTRQPVNGNPGFNMIGIPPAADKFTISYFDVNTNKRGSVYLQRIAGIPDQLIWQLNSDREQVIINNLDSKMFSIPLKMTLKRVQ